LKMMQKEHRQTQIVMVAMYRPGPLHGIDPENLNTPPEGDEMRPSRLAHEIVLIEKNQIAAGPPRALGAQQTKQQRPVSRAELENSTRRNVNVQARDRALEDRKGTHRAMDTLQIDARPPGARIIGRQA